MNLVRIREHMADLFSPKGTDGPLFRLKRPFHGDHENWLSLFEDYGPVVGRVKTDAKNDCFLRLETKAGNVALQVEPSWLEPVGSATDELDKMARVQGLVDEALDPPQVADPAQLLAADNLPEGTCRLLTSLGVKNATIATDLVNLLTASPTKFLDTLALVMMLAQRQAPEQIESVTPHVVELFESSHAPADRIAKLLE